MGERTFAVITSFDDEVGGNGVVWRIKAFEIDREKYLYAMISFLDKPVNTCFDKKHHLLFVCELDMQEVNGKIYAYHIKWDSDNDFELDEFTQTVVYEGSGPMDCAVDSKGNLIFSTVDDQILAINYKDIGNAGLEFPLAGSPDVDSCQALDFKDDETIMWVNNGDSAETVEPVR